MRLVFAGTPAAALPALDALLDSAHDVVAVLTRPDAPAGRGRGHRPAPVAIRARAAGIPVIAPVRAVDAVAQLREIAPDCAPVVAYGQLLGPDLLSVPTYGWVNLHFSLLPAWRGAAPVQHAILHGDDITGATTFALDAGMDTGPIYGVVTERIHPRDTSGALLDRLAVTGATLLRATVDGIADRSLVARAQSGDGVSYAPKLTAEDARIDWTRPAVGVDRSIRATTPNPGAWTTWRDERMGIGPVVLGDADRLPPGVVRVERDRVLVGTGTATVALGEIRPAGRKSMSAVDWARGARTAAEEGFR